MLVIVTVKLVFLIQHICNMSVTDSSSGSCEVHDTEINDVGKWKMKLYTIMHNFENC